MRHHVHAIANHNVNGRIQAAVPAIRQHDMRRVDLQAPQVRGLLTAVSYGDGALGRAFCAVSERAVSQYAAATRQLPCRKLRGRQSTCGQRTSNCRANAAWHSRHSRAQTATARFLTRTAR